MNFIENLLHLSPDGGSGVTELLIVMISVSIAVMLPLRRWLAKRSQQGSAT